MNNITQALLILSLTSISMAQNNNIYVGVGLIMESIDSELIDDVGTAIEIKIGKNIDNNFAIEGKFSKTINEAKDNSFYYDSQTKEKILLKTDIMTYSLSGVYNHKLTNDLIISPRIGYLKEYVDFSFPNKYTNLPSSGEDTGITLGIDIKKYIPSFNANIYAGYTLIDSNVKHFSFGILRNF